MDKKEIIVKVAYESRMNEDECAKVIDALEEVLAQELVQKRGWNLLFDKIYTRMSRKYNRD